MGAPGAGRDGPVLPRGAATALLTFEGGGQLGGDATRLRLTGTSRTTGEFSIGFGEIGIDNTSQVPPLTVNVGAVTCDEAYGDWVFTVEQAFEDEGFTASFDGFWIGFRQSTEVQEEIADLMAEFTSSPDGTLEDIESRSELVGLSSAMRSEFNGFVGDYPTGWTTERVLDMASRTEALLNAWRNLSECLTRLFGADNVEIFVNGLTLVIQGLITGGASDADSAAWVQLAHLGIRTGAFGPGAANPADAVNAEQALIDAGEEILEANVDPTDGGIFVNFDTERVLATGAVMGWSYFVDGQFIDARATYESFFNAEDVE